MKELAIGEVGVVAGETVRCVEKETCGDCFFWRHSVVVCESIKCTCFERQDGQSVMFIPCTNANPCTWTQDANGIFYTSCGQEEEFTTGTREENGYKFCPYCGKEITEASNDNPGYSH